MGRKPWTTLGALEIGQRVGALEIGLRIRNLEIRRRVGLPPAWPREVVGDLSLHGPEVVPASKGILRGGALRHQGGAAAPGNL